MHMCVHMHRDSKFCEDMNIADRPLERKPDLCGSSTYIEKSVISDPILVDQRNLTKALFFFKGFK